MSAKKILYHPLLKWYIGHGLIVTKTYSMIYRMNCKIVKQFGELVSDERRNGDIDSHFNIIGDDINNIGNSGYGRTSMNKSRHASTTFCDIELGSLLNFLTSFINCNS